MKKKNFSKTLVIIFAARNATAAKICSLRPTLVQFTKCIALFNQLEIWNPL